MMKVFIILLGVISIFGSCNKTVPVIQFKLYVNGVLTNGHWSQVSGPSTLIFDNTDTSVVNITTNNPKLGVYVFKGDVTIGYALDTITVIK